jgi:L-ribulose-5-phosphate 4-epimerase
MLFFEQRTEIIKMCKKMQEKGCFLGTWGNISVREEDCIVLTPSRINYDEIAPGDMVVIGLDGTKVEGHRIPTSEKEVHRQIYLARDDVFAIIHAHTEKAMAVSAMNIREVPCMVEEMSQMLGGAIPLTGEYISAEQHAVLGVAAARAIRDKNGVILKNHGPVACGKTLRDAELTVAVMEKACSIYLSLCGECKISEIPQRYIESERFRFANTYGKENL